MADHKHERPVEDELQRGTGGATKAGDHGRSSGGNRAKLVNVHHNLVCGGTKVWDVRKHVKVWGVGGEADQPCRPTGDAVVLSQQLTRAPSDARRCKSSR